ncbi:MAG: hypothetical protein HWN80_17450 [Candidatus Lokiarchaeota archaeon]|nr:hypothetical protein [Candidatus Lokiarchaeota archaeon]
MTLNIQLVNGIGKKTAERMKQEGIDSVERLASSSIENLSKIRGIGDATAKRYINTAQNYLETIKEKEREANISKEEVRQISISSEESIYVPKTSLSEEISLLKEELINQNSSSSNSKEILDVPRLSKKSFDIAQKYVDNIKVVERENKTIKKGKNQINLSLEKFLEDVESSISEEMLENSKLANEENIVEVPIKPLITLKKEKTVPTKSEKVKSKKKSKRKKDSVKKKQNLPPIVKEESNLIQIKSKFQTQTAKKQQLTHNIQQLREKDQKIIYSNNTQIKVEKSRKGKPLLRTYFSPETMQKIRFFHFKIKHLEVRIRKNEDFLFHDLDSIVDYVEILNINYKTQSQIKIFKELEITPTFYDPLEKKEIEIWDLTFECARVLWVAAQACSYLSKKFESEGASKNAIVAMVECSKMYKAAAYFSAACIRQENKGTTLSAENLELNSEESRILAQSLATMREEQKQNLSTASNLCAGLSALTKRLYFLKRYDKIKEKQLKAQYNYDIGNACHLKAKSLSKMSDNGDYNERIEDLQKKANYYFYKAEKTWEYMLENLKELSKDEKENIQTNLSIVNELIIENDVEIINDNEAMKLQDPEPLIIVPENLAPFLPRTTNYLTQYKPKDLNFHAYKRYKNLLSEISVNYNKMEELQNRRAGIGRTLKQLGVLYDNNDIDISEYTHLFEKYSTILATIENVIEKIKNPEKQSKINKQQIRETKSLT